jgi:WS/DGAT/MGAT family acyltransferase
MTMATAVNYERLTALDETFLAFETPNTYMHVALVTLFEPGSLVDGGGLDIDRIRRYFASRLHLVPRYRQKLRMIPLTGDAVWIDDSHFEMEYHVRHASLPRPGGMKQLQRRCAEILERPLDRERPMWESWFIEGLEGGRFAMITKVHHCMVDGVAGVDILAALLALEPTPSIEAPARWKPRAAPGDRELLGDEMVRRVRASGRLLRGLGALASDPSRTGSEVPKRVSALVNLLRASAAIPPPAPFNQPVGPHRRLAWTETAIDDIVRIKATLGGSLNDVVLATTAGAVRRFLEARGEAVVDPFRVVVPVSVRTRDERGQTGNRVSAWIVDLPVDETAPKRRHARIVEMTKALKHDQSALGGQMLTEAAELTTGNILSLGARFINQSHLYNMIVTNVPGPHVPLYLLDSRMAESFPHVPLFADQGLGIALFSYDTKLYWGIAADWDLVPDVADLGSFVDEAFAELCAASRPRRASGSRTKASRRRGGAGSAHVTTARQVAAP